MCKGARNCTLCETPKSKDRDTHSCGLCFLHLSVVNAIEFIYILLTQVLADAWGGKM